MKLFGFFVAGTLLGLPVLAYGYYIARLAIPSLPAVGLLQLYVAGNVIGAYTHTMNHHLIEKPGKGPMEDPVGYLAMSFLTRMIALGIAHGVWVVLS